MRLAKLWHRPASCGWFRLHPGDVQTVRWDIRGSIILHRWFQNLVKIMSYKYQFFSFFPGDRKGVTHQNSTPHHRRKKQHHLQKRDTLGLDPYLLSNELLTTLKSSKNLSNLTFADIYIYFVHNPFPHTKIYILSALLKLWNKKESSDGKHSPTWY